MSSFHIDTLEYFLMKQMDVFADIQRARGFTSAVISELDDGDILVFETAKMAKHAEDTTPPYQRRKVRFISVDQYYDHIRRIGNHEGAILFDHTAQTQIIRHSIISSAAELRHRAKQEKRPSPRRFEIPVF